MVAMQALESTLRWIALRAIFRPPFACIIVATSLFFPYITGKNFVFGLIVEIMTGAWLVLVSVNYRLRRSWALSLMRYPHACEIIAAGIGLMAGRHFNWRGESTEKSAVADRLTIRCWPRHVRPQIYTTDTVMSSSGYVPLWRGQTFQAPTV